MSPVTGWFWTTRCGGVACESRGGLHALQKEDKAVPHLRDSWLRHYCVIQPLWHIWLFMYLVVHVLVLKRSCLAGLLACVRRQPCSGCINTG